MSDLDLDAIQARLDRSVYGYARWSDTVADANFIAHAPADIAALLAEVERLRAALAAVEALHAPVVIEEGDEPWCEECAKTGDEEWETIKYPCATVRAIREAMGDE